MTDEPGVTLHTRPSTRRIKTTGDPMFYAQTYAEAHTITTEDPRLDSYARKGLALSHDAASLALAALQRDAYELRTRGGEANREAANLNERLATAILRALR